MDTKKIMSSNNGLNFVEHEAEITTASSSGASKSSSAQLSGNEAHQMGTSDIESTNILLVIDQVNKLTEKALLEKIRLQFKIRKIDNIGVD